ncbi:hypothetical protein M0805_007633 [Coniferiporia weirii]|nr:hypothetical protein M0805_007633 [Coniferiporia weirii]
MSTRQRRISPENPSIKQDTPENLVPKRRGKALRPVAKPLTHTRLTNLIYILVGLGALLSAFYGYRIIQWKSEVGGWWNLALGKRPPQMQPPPQAGSVFGGAGIGSGRGKGMELEDHISGLASILGMQPTDLAAALSTAVGQHVAPKTLSSLSSSMSSSASAAGAGATAAEALFRDNNGDLEAEAGAGGGDTMSKAGSIARAVEAIVGSEEPIEAD